MAIPSSKSSAGFARRLAVLAYGGICYLMFLGVFLYAVGFIGGFLAPTQLDGARAEPLWKALAVDCLLVLVFGLQHSVMARPGFKRWWTKLVPQEIERSTYVLASNAALALLYWQWRPLGGVVWNIQDPIGREAVWMLFAAGWIVVLVTTVLIDHFELFGLRQTWSYFRGRECASPAFVMPGPYRHVRHPLYVGWLLTFWATPTMTAAHLVFAATMTAYILIAIRYEERDLVQAHPEYVEYRRQVPMLLPRWKKPANSPASWKARERFEG